MHIIIYINIYRYTHAHTHIDTKPYIWNHEYGLGKLQNMINKKKKKANEKNLKIITVKF